MGDGENEDFEMIPIKRRNKKCEAEIIWFFSVISALHSRFLISRVFGVGIGRCVCVWAVSLIKLIN